MADHKTCRYERCVRNYHNGDCHKDQFGREFISTPNYIPRHSKIQAAKERQARRQELIDDAVKRFEAMPLVEQEFYNQQFRDADEQARRIVNFRGHQ